ncbi:MAG: hypothetical protein QM644_07600, partial [Mobilitalea sp.]
RVNINFHQTFKPKRQYISSILNVANSTSSMSVKDISACTGIPNGQSSGKVEPHIYYASYMGLIEYEKKESLISLTRTKLGETVSIEDPGLQEKLTILLCHAMMMRDVGGADIWNAVFKRILPMYRSGIKKEILIRELEQLFDRKVNKKNFAPFIGSYEEMFACINILSIDAECIKANSLLFNNEFLYLYTYILFEYWDELFDNQEEISSIQLEALNYGKVFGWDMQTEYELLQHLSDKGLLRLNRQLMPYSILRLVDKDAVLGKLYSELC